MPACTSNTIQTISEILSERYNNPSTIIKEIVQNANDARANSLYFMDLPSGISNSSLSILNEHLFIVINDGPFDHKGDWKGIRTLGARSEGKGVGKLGKFGVGLKSIFHLSDLFFYVAKSQGRQTSNILNPFFDEDNDGYYKEIEDDFKVTQDELPEQVFLFLLNQAIQANFLSLVKTLQGPDVFILIAPLRYMGNEAEDSFTVGCQFQLGDKVAYHFVDHQSEGCVDPYEQIVHKVSEIMPSLNHLKSVYYLECNDIKISVKIQETSETQTCERSFTFPPNVTDNESLNAVISQVLDHKILSCIDVKYVTQEGDIMKHKIDICGLEALMPINKFEDFYDVTPNTFQELRDHEYWPGESGTKLAKKDKVIPHYGILIHRTPKRSKTAQLSIKWAVFLPLSGKRMQEDLIIDTGDYDYTLLLHCYSFIDSGRNDFKGWDQFIEGDWAVGPAKNQKELIYLWNQTLAQGVLYRLIESFNDRSLLKKDSYDSVKSLLNGFTRSRLWHQRALQRLILQDVAFVTELALSEMSPQDSEFAFKWSKLNAQELNDALVIYPNKKSDLPLSLSLSPRWFYEGLKEICKQRRVVVKTNANLCRPQQLKAEWTIQYMELLLGQLSRRSWDKGSMQDVVEASDEILKILDELKTFLDLHELNPHDLSTSKAEPLFNRYLTHLVEFSQYLEHVSDQSEDKPIKREAYFAGLKFLLILVRVAHLKPALISLMNLIESVTLTDTLLETFKLIHDHWTSHSSEIDVADYDLRASDEAHFIVWHARLIVKDHLQISTKHLDVLDGRLEVQIKLSSLKADDKAQLFRLILELPDDALASQSQPLKRLIQRSGQLLKILNGPAFTSINDRALSSWLAERELYMLSARWGIRAPEETRENPDKALEFLQALITWRDEQTDLLNTHEELLTLLERLSCSLNAESIQTLSLNKEFSLNPHQTFIGFISTLELSLQPSLVHVPRVGEEEALISTLSGLIDLNDVCCVELFPRLSAPKPKLYRVSDPIWLSTLILRDATALSSFEFKAWEKIIEVLIKPLNQDREVDTNIKRLMRFLCHNKLAALDELNTPIYIKSSSEDHLLALAQRIAPEALYRNNELLSHLKSEVASRRLKEHLGIKPFNDQEINDIIRGAINQNRSVQVSIPDALRQALLKESKLEDETWKVLPIHRRCISQGRYEDLAYPNQKIYWTQKAVGQIKLYPSLHRIVAIINYSGEGLEEAYTRRLLNKKLSPWSDEQALRELLCMDWLVLSSEARRQRESDILNCLGEVKRLSEHTKSLLAQYPWLIVGSDLISLGGVAALPPESAFSPETMNELFKLSGRCSLDDFESIELRKMLKRLNVKIDEEWNFWVENALLASNADPTKLQEFLIQLPNDINLNEKYQETGRDFSDQALFLLNHHLYSCRALIAPQGPEPLVEIQRGLIERTDGVAELAELNPSLQDRPDVRASISHWDKLEMLNRLLDEPNASERFEQILWLWDDLGSPKNVEKITRTAWIPAPAGYKPLVLSSVIQLPEVLRSERHHKLKPHLFGGELFFEELLDDLLTPRPSLSHYTLDPDLISRHLKKLTNTPSHEELITSLLDAQDPMMSGAICDLLSIVKEKLSEKIKTRLRQDLWFVHPKQEEPISLEFILHTVPDEPWFRMTLQELDTPWCIWEDLLQGLNLEASSQTAHILKSCLPLRDDVIKRLIDEDLASLPEYWVSSEIEVIKSFNGQAQGALSSSLPGLYWALEYRDLAGALHRRMELPALKRGLNKLADLQRNEVLKADDVSALYLTWLKYLGELAKSVHDLPQYLLNAHNELRKTSQLDWGVDPYPYDPSFRLHPAHQDVLSHLVPDRAPQYEPSSSGEHITEWFDHLAEIGVSNYHLFLLAFFFKQQSIFTRYETSQLKESHIVNKFSELQMKEVRQSEISIAIINSDQNTILSICETPLIIYRSSDLSQRSLLFDQRTLRQVNSSDKRRKFECQFFSLKGSNTGDLEYVLNMMKQSIIELLRCGVFGRNLNKSALHILEKLWDEGANRNIDVTREHKKTRSSLHKTIRYHLNSEVLYSIVKAIELREQNIAEGDPSRIESQKKILRTKRDELISYVISNNSQTELFRALRSDIGKNLNYKPSQILFELFQNADDALIEQAGSTNSTVYFVQDQSSVYILHYGRPINNDEGVKSHSERTRRRGDLENILRIKHTSKYEGEGVKRTGQFGYGFKSCYLFTDEPWIYSDRMYFKIKGSMIPMILSDEELSELKSGFKDSYLGDPTELSLTDERYTLMRLKRSSAPEVTEELQREIWETTKRHIELLSIFARGVQGINLDGDLYGGQLERRLTSTSKVDVSYLNSKLHVHIGYLIFKFANAGLSDDRSFYRVVIPVNIHTGELIGDHHHPTFWKTAPLGVHLSTPLIMSAPFHLKSDRNDLPFEHNRDLMVTLGELCSLGLVALSSRRIQSMRDHQEWPEKFAAHITRGLLQLFKPQAKLESIEGFPNQVLKACQDHTELRQLPLFDHGFPGINGEVSLEQLKSARIISPRFVKCRDRYHDFDQDVQSGRLITESASHQLPSWLRPPVLSLEEVIKKCTQVNLNQELLKLSPSISNEVRWLFTFLNASERQNLIPGALQVMTREERFKPLGTVIFGPEPEHLKGALLNQESNVAQLIADAHRISKDYTHEELGWLLAQRDVNEVSKIISHDRIERDYEEKMENLKKLKGDVEESQLIAEIDRLEQIYFRWKIATDESFARSVRINESRSNPTSGHDEGEGSHHQSLDAQMTQEDKNDSDPIGGLITALEMNLQESSIVQNYGLAVESCWRYLKERQDEGTADLSEMKFDKDYRKFLDVTLIDNEKPKTLNIMPRSAQRGYVYFNPHLYRTLERADHVMYVYLESRADEADDYLIIDDYSSLSKEHPNHVILKVDLPNQSSIQRSFFEHMKSIHRDGIKISALMHVKSLQTSDQRVTHSIYDDLISVKESEEAVARLKKNNKALEM